MPDPQQVKEDYESQAQAADEYSSKAGLRTSQSHKAQGGLEMVQSLAGNLRSAQPIEELRLHLYNAIAALKKLCSRIAVSDFVATFVHL